MQSHISTRGLNIAALQQHNPSLHKEHVSLASHNKHLSSYTTKANMIRTKHKKRIENIISKAFIKCNDSIKISYITQYLLRAYLAWSISDRIIIKFISKEMFCKKKDALISIQTYCISSFTKIKETAHTYVRTRIHAHARTHTTHTHTRTRTHAHVMHS